VSSPQRLPASVSFLACKCAFFGLSPCIHAGHGRLISCTKPYPFFPSITRPIAWLVFPLTMSFSWRRYLVLIYKPSNTDANQRYIGTLSNKLFVVAVRILSLVVRASISHERNQMLGCANNNPRAGSKCTSPGLLSERIRQMELRI
jgi:hypothetical protein